MSSASKPFSIPSLDGIRCVAVMTVFVSHSLDQAHLRNLVPGSFGVTVFFFLSGYLITTLMRQEHEATGTVAMGQFYLRRAFRILPPFYLVLFTATAATVLGFLPNQISPAAVLAQAVHLTNYYVVRHGWWEGLAPGTWIFWSLAVEEHFYLVFPWIFLGLSRLPNRKQRAIALWVLCGAVLLWRCVLLFALDAPKDRLYAATDTRFDSILYGCALALWGNPVLDPSRFSEKAWKWGWLPLGLGGLITAFALRGHWFLETFRYTVQGLSLIPVFVVAIRWPTFGPMRALNWAWMRWIGLISYSLYLVHPTLLEAIDAHLTLGPAALLAVALVVCVGVAAGIYYVVEVPAGRLRRRLQTHGGGAPNARLAAAVAATARTATH